MLFSKLKNRTLNIGLYQKRKDLISHLSVLIFMFLSSMRLTIETKYKTALSDFTSVHGYTFTVQFSLTQWTGSFKDTRGTILQWSTVSNVWRFGWFLVSKLQITKFNEIIRSSFFRVRRVYPDKNDPCKL